MASVNIKKRGKVYQYQFEIATVKGKRKWITKSGFKTKAEAQEEGNKAFTEYLTAGVPFKECNISYSDYLDYWLDNYCKVNLKYRYSVIVNKYLKIYLGHFRLNAITSYQLNKYLIDVCRRYDYSYGYLKNFVKVIECSFRVATDIVKYPYKVVHTELGIENCRFYDLRGSYATKSLRNGV